MSPNDRKKLLDRTDESMSFREQCKLLSISRAGVYYEPKGETRYNIELMHMIDAEYTLHPEMGVPSMTAFLRNEGKKCGPKRIRRLMRKMGLEAIYPKPRTSVPNKQHKIYPYLLKGVTATQPNQVWSTDITYVKLQHGYAYLVAIMDWYSRKVLSWRLSNTMDVGFCCEALEEALFFYGTPEIFNTDQGSQFTSEAFTCKLKEKGISISMTGTGRALDNVFVERLWRTVKYNNIYIKGYETIPEAQAGLEEYFEYYNGKRPHSSLENKSPDMVYYGKSCAHIHSINKEKKRSKRREMAAATISYF